MFDDQLNNQGLPPSNLPTEPVDMFAETEKETLATPPQPDALSAGLLKKKEGDDVPVPDMNTGMLNPAPMYAMKEPILGKIILVIVFVVILGGLGFGGWWIYNNYFNDTNNTTTGNVENTATIPTVPNVEVTTPTTTENENDTSVITTGTIPTDTELNRDINNDKILFGEPIDTDKDGLDDVRESEIGTKANVADTDEDGLIDGDEVIIWKTDPLNPDTDGDTHIDGKEVKNGYNPLGPGKLFQVSPTTSTTSTK